MPEAAPRVTLDPPGLTRRIPLQPHQMTATVTPTDQLFMLAHLGVARPMEAGWILRVDGMVGRKLRLSLDDLMAMPQTRVEAVHQCAGSPLEPNVPTRRAACVIWEGVRLAEVLSAALVAPEASFLWSDGADGGTFAGEAVPFYRKDLPLWRAAEDVLLATRLNGAPIPDEHGGPLRLVVPGFFGTNSVKWLWRLTLAERRADGPFTTTYYNDRLPDGTARPVWALAPEAVFTTPAPGDLLGGTAHLRGWAWSDAPVTRVEVSDDDGQTWRVARLDGRRGRAWQAWSLEWSFARRGAARLLCRATDAAGATQPMEGARNAVHAVEVVARTG
ncbi:molybdopterin-dependent oxidoreductase [Sabulicella glaciei]|nr:molybdopterin-dependent oxidoreductase [Roseococcus sp. MDT2-1-1]